MKTKEIFLQVLPVTESFQTLCVRQKKETATGIAVWRYSLDLPGPLAHPFDGGFRSVLDSLNIGFVAVTDEQP